MQLDYEDMKRCRLLPILDVMCVIFHFMHVILPKPPSERFGRTSEFEQGKHLYLLLELYHENPERYGQYGQHYAEAKRTG